jgi:TetR/AcrR family transcriptional repressor of nem operon
MQRDRSTATQSKLIAAATELIRRKGYIATTIDEICEQAGLTKGAFFHHYASKEELAQACLEQWDVMGAAMDAGAPFQSAGGAAARVTGYMDFYISLFDDPALLKSCLAGTTVQEVANTNPVLRDAANACFVNAATRFRKLLDAACRGSRKRVATASLAEFWISSVQGSLILFKSSQDAGVIHRNLVHAKKYIVSQLPSVGTKTAQRGGRI